MRALTAKLRSDVGGIDVEKVNQKVRERLAAVWHERTE